MNLDDSLSDRKPTDSEVNLVVNAARRITGEHKAMRNGNGIVWKIASPLIGAVVMGLAVLFWNALRGEITKGKADETKVEAIQADVTVLQTSVTTLQTDMTDVKKEQKESSKLLKRVARKLHVEE